MPAGSPGTAGALALPLGRGPALQAGHLPPLRNCEPRTAWWWRFLFHVAFLVVLTDVFTRSGSGIASEERMGRERVRCPQTGREWVFVKAERCGHHSSLYSVPFCICLNFFTVERYRKEGRREKREEGTTEEPLYTSFAAQRSLGLSLINPTLWETGSPAQAPDAEKGRERGPGSVPPGSAQLFLLLSGRVGAFLLPRTCGYL